MLVAPASHPDLATHFTVLTHRVPSIPRLNTMSSDLSSRGPLHKPGHHSRRLQRHDSAISTTSTTSRGPLIDLDLSINNRRSRSPRRGTQDIHSARQPVEPPTMLPIYEPRPVLHREDAFKVVEAAPPTRRGALAEPSGYESDELEFCTTQFPEFGEECMYDYWP